MNPSAQDIYNCTPRQAYSHMCEIIEAGLVPNLISSPGMGKSSLFRKTAKRYNLFMKDKRVSTSSSVDFSGLPEFYTDAGGIRRARFVPFDDFPVAGTPIPKGYDGWLLFLDEFNAGLKLVQAAAYQLVLDRYVGMYPLHERVVMGMAGNHATDRAIVNPLSTAMQSRVIHIHMVINFDEWLYDVAIAEDYDPRIVAYLNFDQSALFDFKPDHQDKTFNCPRTWEFMNKLVKGKSFNEITHADGTIEHEMDRRISLYGGTITSGQAAAFVQFTKMAGNIVSVQDILADPLTCRIPINAEGRWMAVTHAMNHVSNDNFGPLATYFGRYDLAFRILFFRIALAKYPALRQHPEFINVVSQVSQYLHGA